jgi:hypothetical protein
VAGRSTQSLERIVDRAQIQLAEYQEAAQVCRAHEANARMAVSVFLALAGGIIAVSFTNTVAVFGKVVLLFLGLGVSLLMLNVVLRHQQYYRAYLARAKVLEAALEMTLYTEAGKEAESFPSFSNKTALAAVIGLLSIFFLVSAIYFANQL